MNDSPAPGRGAIRAAWVALSIAVLALLSYPLLQWWAGQAPAEHWPLGVVFGLAVTALVFGIAPIALIIAAAFFWIAWRDHARSGSS
ncbi:hypothetical protein [Cellulosimicrobium sp. NPDC057127]|uniref:hypothetical protein n=1 Tax=Cellulosimicrobium sp. NPDC057127 TaxID=3346026 RepID=UPI00362743A9